MSEIRIAIKSLHEIATAYSQAIEAYCEEMGDCWGEIIRLKHIEFQSNFRRAEYICVFEVLEKSKDTAP